MYGNQASLKNLQPSLLIYYNVLPVNAREALFSIVLLNCWLYPCFALIQTSHGSVTLVCNA